MVKQIIATSDNSNVSLMLTALVVSGIALVIYLIYILLKNKKNKG